MIALIALFWLNLTVGTLSESKISSKYQVSEVEDIIEASDLINSHVLALPACFIFGYHPSAFFDTLFSGKSVSLIERSNPEFLHTHCSLSISIRSLLI